MASDEGVDGGGGGGGSNGLLLAVAPGNEGWQCSGQLWSLEEAVNALGRGGGVGGVASGGALLLTKRVVIEQIRSVAPSAWLRDHQLHHPIKSLLKTLNVQKTLSKYSTFLMAYEAAAAASSREVATPTAGTALTAEQKNHIRAVIASATTPEECDFIKKQLKVSAPAAGAPASIVRLTDDAHACLPTPTTSHTRAHPHPFPFDHQGGRDTDAEEGSGGSEGAAAARAPQQTGSHRGQLVLQQWLGQHR